ncbi:hypothetical protein M9H77_16135 [Catharanthus roseus]|uniref:Uncharacterized protein n=1 Tax=Catharanthus roseus TaxID=4058 RepID=A0ACC0AZ15_CATRO|nr:hypothetical protein M9H77_16135 [Catharanthus roseus]
MNKNKQLWNWNSNSSLAKNKSENRIKIAKAGGIKPLISIISSNDPQLQDYGVTAILNLSLCDENKEYLALAGAIKLGNFMAKENTACALFRLSQIDTNKTEIGRVRGIPPLPAVWPVYPWAGCGWIRIYTIWPVKNEPRPDPDCLNMGRYG